MTTSADINAPTQPLAASVVAPAGAGGRTLALIEATKPGITRMVTITAGVGFVLGWLERATHAPNAAAASAAACFVDAIVPFLACLVGTALSASGANALNQWMERDRDARMHRTRSRPIPSGRASTRAVLLAGILSCVAGLGTLAVAVGPPASAVSLGTILTYLLIYTPLKPITTWSTVVGAVPGALPPVLGVAAAAGTFASIASPLALALFAILFLWQMPHFYAIGVMYADDYRRGGYRILPVIDATGRRTARAMVLWSAALVVAAVVPALFLGPLLTPISGLIAAAATGLFFLRCTQYSRTLAREDAKRAFIASVIVLPVLLLALTGEAIILAALR